MTDDRRLLLAVVLCLGIYAGWSWIVMSNRHAQLANMPPTSAQTVPTPTPGAPASAPTAVAPTPGEVHPTPVGPAPAGSSAAAAPAAPPVRLPEKLLSLDTPELHLVFSSHGGTLAHAVLQNPQYRRHLEGKDVPVDLVRGPGADGRDLQTRFEGASWADDPLADYEGQVEPGGRAVNFRRVVGGGAGGTVITKRYEAVSPYLISLHIAVSGGTAQSLAIDYGGEQPPAAAAATGLLSHVIRSYPNVAAGLCRVDGANKSGASDKDASQTLPETGAGTVQFGGLDEKFFVSAIAPQGDRHGTCTASSTKSGEVQARGAASSGP